MIARVVALIGTARPRPMPATAVLTPTTRPWLSARAPPELPGLSAASVWMTSSMILATPLPRAGQRAAERGDDARRDRSGEAVRVADRDHQLTDAQSAASPSSAAARPPSRVRSTARSLSGSAPTTSNVDLAAVGERGKPVARRAAATRRGDDVRARSAGSRRASARRRCRRRSAPAGRRGGGRARAGWRPMATAARPRR